MHSPRYAQKVWHQPHYLEKKRCSRESVTAPRNELFIRASAAVCLTTCTHLPPTQQPVNNERFSSDSEQWVCLVSWIHLTWRPFHCHCEPRSKLCQKAFGCRWPWTNPAHYFTEPFSCCWHQSMWNVGGGLTTAGDQTCVKPSVLQNFNRLSLFPPLLYSSM